MAADAAFPNRFFRWGRLVWTGLIDLLYPPRCLHCRRRAPKAALPLCGPCLRRMEHPSPEDVANHLARLPAGGTALNGAVPLWRFERDGPLQAVQHALKYGNRPRYGIALGRLMGAAYEAAGAPVPTAVIPIPLHRARYLERGYNQSATLARGVGDALGVPVRPGLLMRSRPTRSQTNLSRAERWQNVSGAFVTPQAAALTKASLLLVDDVLTTGSTALAAAQVLQAAGAAAIHLTTLAFAEH